jgi:outer membrane murein-binding lipoprotein Lpp
MNPRIRVMALVLSVLLLLVIIDLVRKRKLREEFSWLWLLTGVVVLVLATWQSLVVRITGLIGAKIVVSTLFFGGLMFLTVVNIHVSTKLSELSEQVKTLAQRGALLAEEVERLREERGGTGEP